MVAASVNEVKVIPSLGKGGISDAVNNVSRTNVAGLNIINSDVGVLGLFKEAKASFMLKDNVNTAFYKARTVPFAMRAKVKEELERLEAASIITPVRYSDWAAPIVPVLKRDKSSIRICGDFKLTANIAIDPAKYPLPKAEDIFASLADGEQFSILDLREAYNQLELEMRILNY
nr:uncharacterized protein K02A2.6-like [Parasteatoda tepidariorum]